MLMLALDVLMRVHMRVFRQLREPTVRASMQGLVPWDARAALAAERSKVRAWVLARHSLLIGCMPAEPCCWLCLSSNSRPTTHKRELACLTLRDAPPKLVMYASMFVCEAKARNRGQGWGRWAEGGGRGGGSRGA